MPAETNLLDQLVQQLNSTSAIKIATDMSHVDRLKVAIGGVPKSGKSYLIAKTARKPLLHYDFDDRSESIAGAKDTIIKTLVDKTDDQPVAWGILESDIGTMEYQKEQCVREKKDFPFKSIALDSLTFLRKYAEHQFLKDNSSATRTKFKIGTVNYMIPKDWDAVTGVQKMLETMLSRIFALGVDTYMTFHTRQEKDNLRSTKTETVYKDSLTIDPPNLSMLLPKFNDTWRCFVDTDGQYKVQIHPDYQFNAATVLKNVSDVEEADIQKMLEKHNKQV